MSPTRFLDTNILLRYVAFDDAVQTPLSVTLFEQMALGEIDGLISMTVVFETVFVLERIFDGDRHRIAESIRLVTGAPSLHVLDGVQQHLLDALSLYQQHPQLSFADCYHAILALEHCDGEIHTFDREFRRVPGITRLEPDA